MCIWGIVLPTSACCWKWNSFFNLALFCPGIDNGREKKLTYNYMYIKWFFKDTIFLFCCQRHFKSFLGGVYMRKKHPGYSRINRVPRLAGIILIFVYMRSFVPVCRDEYVAWCCFGLVQYDFRYRSAIITLNSAFILS